MTINPNSLANLVPDHRYKSGDNWVGNKIGKPRGTLNRTTIYRQLLQAPVKSLRNAALSKQLEELGLADSATIEELLLAKHISLSVCGKPEVELRAIEIAQDNAYGKQTQSTVNLNADLSDEETAALDERIRKLKEQYKSEF